MYELDDLASSDAAFRLVPGVPWTLVGTAVALDRGGVEQPGTRDGWVT
ncbi:MAG: hypothetical protein M3046_15285 [Actinomycetota bacterium]|nr:hypothetical protein [Actinomycetota bacterium]